ncbi:MAG: glycosyltransferase family 4 protein [Rhodospirillales bacterium]|nr:glycosyltransferase family 4 protein [Rhodospirillales bacterium]
MIVVAGGLRDPGGVTRCMEYLIGSWRGSARPPDYRIIDPRGVGSIARSPWYFLKALAAVGREAAADRSMIVHANMCEYGSTLRKLPIVCLARLLGAHAVIHLHGAEVKAMFDAWPAWLRWLFRQSVARADRIVVLGNSWKEFLCSDVGIRPEQVVIIPNAVPVPAEPRRASPTGRCRVLFLGRLEERKGAGRLLAALHSPTMADVDCDVVMAGDGDVDFYRNMAESLGLRDRVRFTGWLDRPAVVELMATSDVLVLPSLNEGLPMAILEAMANGLAVVTTPVGAITDVIREEETGLLVPPGDAAALASALRRVVIDPELRCRLGQQARSLAQTEFDIASYGDRFIVLYDEVSRKSPF